MADTELQGVIRLDADTRQAQDDVAEFADAQGQESGERFGRRFGQNLAGEVTNRLRAMAFDKPLGALGPVGGAVQRAVSQQRQQRQAQRPEGATAQARRRRTPTGGTGEGAGAAAQRVGGQRMLGPGAVAARRENLLMRAMRRLRESVDRQRQMMTRRMRQQRRIGGGNRISAIGQQQSNRPMIFAPRGGGGGGGRAGGGAAAAGGGFLGGRGLAIGGAVAAGVAILGVVAGLKRLADQVNTTNRELSQAGGTMAGVMANFEARMRVLNIALGQRVAGSAMDLNEVLLERERRLQDMKDTVQNLKNRLDAFRLGIGNQILGAMGFEGDGDQRRGMVMQNQMMLRAAETLGANLDRVLNEREMNRYREGRDNLPDDLPARFPTRGEGEGQQGERPDGVRRGAMPGPLDRGGTGNAAQGGAQFRDFGIESIRRREERIERARDRMQRRLDEMDKEGDE